MSIYLIDYENVHYAGLKGIDHLNPQDEVILFYGNSASTIPMELHIDIANSGAKVQYIKIDKIGKNYLDFQLSATAGYKVGTTEQTNYIIISKDTGFDAVLDLWNGPNISGRKLTFSRQEQIVVKDAGKSKKGKSKKATVTKTAVKTSVKKSTDKKTTIKKVESKIVADKSAANKQPMKKNKITEAQKKAIRGAVKDLALKPSDYTKVYKAFMEQKDKQAFNNELVKHLKQEAGNNVYKNVVKLYEAAKSAEDVTEDKNIKKS